VTVATFITKNALRNKRRAALCILSVAVSLFLLVSLLVVLREFTIPPEDIGAAARVVVRNRISLANPLPYRQRAVIEKLPGVEAVSPFSWFGGKFRSEEFTAFAQFAMDPKLLRPIFGEAKMGEDEYANFERERTACILGKLTADKYGLKVGDKMVLESTIYPCTIELKIAGIYSGTIDDRNVLFHHDYLDEASGLKGTVGTWWVKARSLDEVAPVVTAINEAFKNTSCEVRAETERAFQLSFVSMLGNIQVLIGSICTVVVFSLVLVAASTMSMAVRERFRELAVLKALGFRQRELFAFILAESFGLAMVGAVLGVGGAWYLFEPFQLMQKVTGGLFITFEVTWRIIGTACAVAAGLGIVASIAPAIGVARMSVVQGLKTLD